jgi:PAS domain S-box-containing protein
MPELTHGVPIPLAPAPGAPDRVLAALGDLEVAQEELRVAEEELAEQREQIEQLVAQHHDGQRWRDHLFALLPVGVLVSDGEGKILEANGRVADLLGVQQAHLPGKPFLVYVEPPHRRLVRDLLVRLRRGSPEVRATVTLRPRDGDPLTADLVALPDVESPPGTLHWLVIPQGGQGVRPSAHAAADGDAGEQSLRMATAVAKLCALPVDTADQQLMLHRIALVMAAAVPGATAVSVSLGDPAAPDRLASDSTQAQVFDGLQLRCAEGPCVEAFRETAVVVTDDVTADARWPRLAAAARGQPVRSVLALPIRAGEERSGAVNLYATRPGAFTESTVQLGEVLASAVAAVLREVGERASLQALVRHLERALSSRAVIEQAKGIVMAHHGGTADEAFAKLVAFSSRQNVKLRELAESIVRGEGTARLRGL